MKKFLSKYFPAIPVVIVLVSMMFSNSCANTTQAPTGGVKDTIPPVIVKMVPENYSTNVPLSGTEFVFTFDEYVTLKNAKNIFLSPPQKKAPKSKLRGKSVVITFEEELLPNTTYTLDFLDAVADNNEGNMFPGFTYVFSTGSTIDSMMVTGIVQDCNTLKPLKGITVMLYNDLADSAVFLHRPYAATKTDDWGYFCIRNIKDTLYRLYAVKDGNNNNIYDPDELELIAFVDTALTPKTVVRDTLPEVMKFSMNDTLNCLARKTEYELNLFKEKPSSQTIMKKVRVDDRSSYITFRAPNAHIDSMWIRGISSDRLITQFNIQRDSLEIWVNDRKKIPDTLHLFVNYMKTDSAGRLRPDLEHVKIYYQSEDGSKTTVSKSSKRDIKHEDTLCVYTLAADPTTVEQVGFQLEFKHPIIYEGFDSLKLKAINPRQQESLMPVEVIPDSMNLRKFTIMPKEKLQIGYDYILKMPHRRFRDINGYYNDSLDVKVTLPVDGKLSTLSLTLKNVENKYLIDLLDEKKSKVLRSYIIDKDEELIFPYLKAGNYCIRIIEDVNRNNIVDSGSLLGHIQPEKALFVKFKDDKQYLDIPEASDVVQEINIAELFKHKVSE